MTEAEVNHPAPNLGRRSGVHPTPPDFPKKYIPDLASLQYYNFKKVPFPPFPRHHHHNDPLSWE